jgi:acetyl esterase/lipase
MMRDPGILADRAAGARFRRACSSCRKEGAEQMMDLRVEKDVVFATRRGSDLTLDIYRPSQEGAPVTIYVHGGGWRSGDKMDDSVRRLTPLAAYGVTVVSVNYGLVPAAKFPDQLHDLKAAVRWLRGNGRRLGLPTERLGIWGASAGAYLGSLLALTAGIAGLEGTVGGHFDQSSAVQAVVHWFGQSDLVASGSRTEVEARLLPFAFEAGLLGVRQITEADRAPELSLLSWVSASAPPFLIAHGDRDHIVLPSEGQALHDAPVRAGVQTRFELVGGAGHEGAAFDDPASLALTAAWLRATLAKPVA